MINLGIRTEFKYCGWPDLQFYNLPAPIWIIFFADLDADAQI